MGSECPERVVRELIIIKDMVKKGCRSHAPLISGKSTNGYYGCGLSRHAPQRCQQCCGIHRARRCEVARVSAAETNSCGIDNAGAECVALFQNCGRPRGVRIEDIVVKGVGLL